MTDGPDFIVDPSGNVQDVRRQKYWRTSGTPPPPKTGNGSSGNGKHPRSFIHPPQKPKKSSEPVFVPIGCLVFIIMAVIGLFTRSARNDRYSEFEVDTLNTGNYHLDQGDYDKAVTDFTTIIRRKPSLGEAYNNRGLAYQGLGESDKALADFEKAMQLLPGSAVPYNNRATVFLDAGDYDSAFADLNKALELDPRFSKAYHNLGLIHLGLGDYDAAIADFDKALEFASESILTTFYPRLPSGDKVDMKSLTWSQITGAAEDKSRIYIDRGLAYLTKGDYASALADFDEAVECDPFSALTYYYRGVAHCANGHLGEGIADFEKVLEMNNDLAVQQDAETRLRELGIEKSQ